MATGIAKDEIAIGNTYASDSDPGKRNSFLRLKVEIKKEKIPARRDVCILVSPASQKRRPQIGTALRAIIQILPVINWKI